MPMRWTMKMETEIRAAQAGTVRGIAVKAGDAQGSQRSSAAQ
ncbi:hypothetical protein FK513_29835 [Klebsiella pneumoniae]|nr:biotin/lipoyl-containing protein [Klebsiella pneumoniae]MCQ4033974.1 hypothetical protein [Klebsiella pneumoniae]